MPEYTNQITRIVDRVPFICELIAGKRVLDIGCGSWPNTEKLLDAGTLPHDRYRDAASSIIGCDTEPEVARIMGKRSRTRWLHDFQDGPALPYPVDVVVMGEVLEHMSNPGNALTNIHLSVSSYAKLIATVPNAFCYAAWKRACEDKELVHHEHVAWYSPATLTHLLDRHGWKVNELLGYYIKGKLPEGASLTQAQGIIAVCEKG